MKTTTYKLDIRNYSTRFKQARAIRAHKLARLPYSRKIDIMAKLQADSRTIKKSIPTLR